MFNTQPLSQRDPRWKDAPLGFGSNAITIGSDGCTLTCLAMVVNGFGFQETRFQNHWVVLYARQGGDYLILDPWPVPPMASLSLLQRYGFAGLSAQIITAAVFYDNPNAVPPLPPAIVVNDEPDIHIAGGLALRAQPWTGAVITRLPAGVSLHLAELAVPGLAKVGQPGQWLRVTTTDGTQGYVAAWYVHAAPAPASAMLAAA